MNRKFSITYYDRMTRKLMIEQVYSSSFLFWSYNTRTGRWMTDLLFRQKTISRLYGWIHNQPWSRSKIKSFVQTMNINLDESVCQLEDFKNFNDFFKREIDLKKRPIHKDPEVCIAPADGKILTYPKVEPEKTFRIKRSSFNLHQFLGNDSLAEKFAGGSMVINRLHLSDYHHFHFPDSGIPRNAISIQGNYYVISPYSLSWLVPFYTENHRMLTLFDSDHFGQMAIVEIGAFTVGSIQQ